MTDQLKVSIIIPIYNASSCIERCVLTALNQTVSNKEIICVDDGSTDGTFDILNRLQKEHKSIRVIKQNNSGAGIARNRGLGEANGEYIAFLDSDDNYVDSNALDRMVCFMDTNKVDICGSYRVYEENGEIKESELLKEYDISSDGGIIGYEDFQYDFDYQSFIFRRKFLIKNCMEFPPYRRYQDPPFFVGAMSKAGRFGVVPTTLYCYHSEQKDVNKLSASAEDMIKGVRDVMQIADEYAYKRLYDTSLYRINVEFYEVLRRSLTPNVLRVLLQIEEINTKIKSDIPVGILEEIQKLPEITDALDNSLDSYRELERIGFLYYVPNPLKEYLGEKGICKVAIKGCGKFGAYLVRLLKSTDVRIVGAVDRTGESGFDEFNGIDIYLSEAELPAYDALIVSPIKPKELMEECEKQGLKNVYSFVNILNEIFEKDRE